MLQQPLRGLLIDDDGQKAVLQGIAAEDIGNLRADDGAKPIIEQRPWRMLARRAAAEIAAGHQNLRRLELRDGSAQIRVLASHPLDNANRQTAA